MNLAMNTTCKKIMRNLKKYIADENLYKKVKLPVMYSVHSSNFNFKNIEKIQKNNFISSKIEYTNSNNNEIGYLKYNTKENKTNKVHLFSFASKGFRKDASTKSAYVTSSNYELSTEYDNAKMIKNAQRPKIIEENVISELNKLKFKSIQSYSATIIYYPLNDERNKLYTNGFSINTISTKCSNNKNSNSLSLSVMKNNINAILEKQMTKASKSFEYLKDLAKRIKNSPNENNEKIFYNDLMYKKEQCCI